MSMFILFRCEKNDESEGDAAADGYQSLNRSNQTFNDITRLDKCDIL